MLKEGVYRNHDKNRTRYPGKYASGTNALAVDEDHASQQDKKRAVRIAQPGQESMTHGGNQWCAAARTDFTLNQIAFGASERAAMMSGQSSPSMSLNTIP